MSYTGQTPWERHPDGDELLLALDGELEVTTLTDDGPVTRKLRAGEALCARKDCGIGSLRRSRSRCCTGRRSIRPESMADDPRVVVESRSPGSRKCSEHHAVPVYRRRGPRAGITRAYSARPCHARRRASGIVSHAMLKMGDTTVMLSDPSSADVKQNDVHRLSRPPHSRRIAGASVHLRYRCRRRCEARNRSWSESYRSGRGSGLGRPVRWDQGYRGVMSGLSGRRSRMCRRKIEN